jgi:hypothetical protein
MTSSKSSRKTGTPKPAKKAATTAPATLRVHDLLSGVHIYLPDALRQIVGDKQYRKAVEDLEAQRITVIVRTAKDLVYLHARIVTQPLPETRKRGAAPAGHEASDEAADT